MAITPLNLATKEKQDQILAKQDQTLANFPVSGGTDWSKYKSHYLALVGRSDNSTVTLLDIRGQGYIAYLSVAVGADYWTSNTCSIEIIVDGVQIVNLIRNGGEPNNRPMRYTMDITPNFTSGNSGYRTDNPIPFIATYPKDADVNKKTNLLMYPFFYNQSLVVKARSSGTPSGLELSGGVGR